MYVIWNDVRMMIMLISLFFKWKCKVNLIVVLIIEIIDGLIFVKWFGWINLDYIYSRFVSDDWRRGWSFVNMVVNF